MYTATVLGILGTVAAARQLEPREFGLLAIVLATTGFFQLFLDTTVEEAVVKFGFRYSTAEDWGRLRRLFSVGLAVKLLGGGAAALAIAALAPIAHRVFGSDSLLVPLLLAAVVPIIQAPEGIVGAALIVRGRYDVRGWLLAVSMGLRLTGLAVGAGFGVTEAVVGFVAAQIASTCVVAVVGLAAFRGFPAATAVLLGDDARAVRGFVIRSGVGSGLVSMRTTLSQLLLGDAATPSQVGYFRIAQAPVTGLTSLSAPVRLIMLTEQTRDFERGERDRVWTSLGRYMAGSGALMLAVVPLGWWLMPDLVRLVFGGPYAPGTEAARLLLLVAALQFVFGWSKSLPVSIGRPELRIVAHGIEIAVLCPLLVALGGRWGATGAAGAALAATGAFAGVWTVLLIRLRRGVLAVGPPSVEATPL